MSDSIKLFEYVGNIYRFIDSSSVLNQLLSGIFAGVFVSSCLFLVSLIKKMRSEKIRNNRSQPSLNKLIFLAEILPISWAKIINESAADYEDRINDLWGAGKYRSAKWNQKLAWLCALSNLGHYLWLKAWKPVSTVFRRLL